MIIAELSANHGNSLRTALDTVRAMADAGADAIKLQTYTPDSLTLPVHRDDFLLKGGLWDGRYLHDLYAEARTPYEWHEPIFRLASDLGLICFSTPFDLEGVDFLESLGNPIYKIASFEIAYLDLIRYAASKGKPMVISTGIATPEELREAVEACREAGNDDITLLKCTSAYPARVEDAALGDIPRLRERYGVKVGLSDHSPGSMLPVLATALGATMIEKHFILNRELGGPDAAFSMTAPEFAAMVRDVRQAREALASSPQGEDVPAPKGREWGRSIYVSADIKAGEAFTRDNVRVVRPGLSLHPRHLSEVLAGHARRDLTAGSRLSLDDIG
ncbi:MAG: pseudaminic acid synthase [Muribaculaceae bacterium]|nr:pseudaminic acid synthase [Muribaculaceae bacterium]